MRRLITPSGKPPILDRAQAMGAQIAMLLPTMEDFARRYGLAISLDTEARPWSDPQCILTWTTMNELAGFIYLVGGPGDFVLNVLCWEDKHLIERRQWRSQSRDSTSALKTLLFDAKTWADTVRPTEQ